MKFSSIFILLFLIISPLFAQTEKLTESLNSYSFDLYHKVRGGGENILISPLSTYYTLLMLYEGAESDTREEFIKVIKIENEDMLNNFPAFSEKLTQINNENNDLNISNAIWFNDDFPFNHNYKRKVENRYRTDIRIIDFSDGNAAAREINNWVSDKTEGLFDNIMMPSGISESSGMVIVNAVYFLGMWDSMFFDKDTEADDFELINGDDIEVDFMNQLDSYRYYEDDELKVVGMYYTGRDKSFFILLPDDDDGIFELESKLNARYISEILSNISYKRVELSIPKFRLEVDYSLAEPLKRMGLNKAFTDEGNFNKINEDAPYKIDKIIQNTYIEIDEIKTEAAAVTAVPFEPGALKNPPSPEEFKADHPFVFLIMDENTGGIIFIGRLMDPG